MLWKWHWYFAIFRYVTRGARMARSATSAAIAANGARRREYERILQSYIPCERNENAGNSEVQLTLFGEEVR